MSINRSTLSDQIYKQLREDIILGKLPSGKRITMRELQDQFDISSTPVREALTRLAQDRFVEYITNQGVRVIDLTEEDVRELLDLATLYDCYAVEKAIAHPELDKICTLLQDAIDRQRGYRSVNENSMKEYSAIFSEFHEILYAFADNNWLKDNAMQANSLLFLADVRLPISFPEEAIREHQAILEAIKAGDAPLASSRMREHHDNEWYRYVHGAPVEK